MGYGWDGWGMGDDAEKRVLKSGSQKKIRLLMILVRCKWGEVTGVNQFEKNGGKTRGLDELKPRNMELGFIQSNPQKDRQVTSYYK